MIALDTETHLIAPGVLAPRLVCMSLAWPVGPPPSWLPAAGPDVTVVLEDGPFAPVGGTALLGRDAALAVLPAVLAEDVIVGANLVFDLAVLAAALPAVTPAVFRAAAEGRLSCVQVRERLVANAFGRLSWTKVSLADLAKRYLGLDRSAAKGEDAWRMRYSELDGVLLEDWEPEAEQYPRDDASDTLRVWLAQSAGETLVDGYPLRIPGPSGLPGDVRIVSEERELRAAWALHLMAAYGLRTDPAAVDTLVAEWTKTAAEGREAGVTGGWIRGPGTRPASKVGTLDKKKLQALVAATLGDDTPRTKPTKTFPAGQVQYGEDVLCLVADRPGAPDTLRAYAVAQQATTWLTKWAPSLIHGTTAPLTSKPSHLVATGRTAWAKPPLQQPPKKGGVRECFVPRPGFVFVSVDYDSAELRALAQVHLWLRVGDTLARMFREGIDPLIWMAVEIRNAENPNAPVTYAELAAAKRTWGRPYRDLAKVAMYGIPGGLGAKTLVDYAFGTFGVTITPAKAVELKDTYKRVLPEQLAVFSLVNRQLEHRDSFTFQHPVSGRLRGDVGYCDGCNGFFQGLVADGAKAACWALAEAAYLGTGHARAADFRGSRPVAMLHDEVIAEVPEARATEAAEAMAAIMIDAMQAHIPDVPITASPALMDRWRKDAETVRDASGRLVTWAPTLARVPVQSTLATEP